MNSMFLEPFSYDYMVNAIGISGLIGIVCGFLSCYLILKGWSLIGDALSHAIVPGVAVAYLSGLPFVFGAFVAGGFAAIAMLFLKKVTLFKQDTIIGLIFTSFFALGLFIVSLYPSSVDVQKIILGNILAITPFDKMQIIFIAVPVLLILWCKWQDFMLIFFDEPHARSIGVPVRLMKLLFFAMLSAMSVAALQAVGALLVIAMVVTPGATAYLLTKKFQNMIIIACIIGLFSGSFGAYLSFFLDGATGGVIVLLQSFCFICAFLFSYLRRSPFFKKSRLEGHSL